ncbi:hypothetical protein [Bacillus pseudomycoides]|uniref:hypothetical protein n=1 Tax=Bacillus pseudomycoides TaxID=64104 RepID=UPI000BF17BF8|nr:hypothetical protein [Bacillus pseudomycoides]PEK70473.1 hypothetical protein CN593_05505 [Bacillus pseudomycoides]PEN08643.1 hypothetical protein CN640_13500 [Bacillus pseudomycoides]PFW93867.1 hypothetical protein COL29_12040 [Bacillus pseudomycoides]PFX37586.1 hypothetical protein COL32_26975 [Bacillus pseudomycoides]PGA76436.1 hypothetical protein COL87_01035 [Bacillus pseudomycoides]
MAASYENVTATDLTSGIQINKQSPRTNMNLNKKMTKQKFLMHGPKFFNGLLKQLKREDELCELPASALAVYVGMHYMVNDIGVLPSDFTIAQLAERLFLPYSTAHTGFEILLQRELVKEVIPEKGLPVYEICNYALNNRTKREGNQECKGLSYFRIPKALLDTNILRELVTHRDRKGIYLLLDLCNNFTHELYKQSHEAIEQYTLPRTMKFFKGYLKKNAKKVREYTELLSPIFQFEASHTTVREARETRITRIRKAVNQILVPKFTVHMAASCVVENTDADIKQNEAKMRKEAVSRLKSLGYPLSNKDHRDLVVAFQNEISKIAYLLENKTARTQLMTYTMCYALDALEQYVKTTGQKVKSIGAFVRKKLRESLPSWRFTYLSEHDRHELFVALGRKEVDIPEWLHINYKPDSIVAA